MTPFVRRFIPDSEVSTYEKIRDAVGALPDINLGENEDGKEIILSCHILARAVGDAFNLAYVDGYFLDIYDHSWLVTGNGHIIDVYPVATIGGPILVDGVNFSGSKTLYRPQNGEEMSRGRFSTRSFRESVRTITNALSKNA